TSLAGGRGGWGGLAHRQPFSECMDEGDRRSYRGGFWQAAGWGNRRYHDQGRAGFVVTRHISSPCGMRQRLAARQLTGRLSMARLDCDLAVTSMEFRGRRTER